MIYSSLLFIYGFLPFSLLIYYISPRKLRSGVLLLLSAAFCSLTSLYMLIFMTAYTLINYGTAHLIDLMRKKDRLSAIPLSFGIIIDLAVLFTFRTEYFLHIKSLIRAPELFFPIGISFFTLSAIGMLIDVYRGHIRAERNIVSFGLYFMFFPRLIMGPLLRYGTFKKLLNSRRDGLAEIGVGFAVFVKGLAKKILLADSLYMLYTAARNVDVHEMSALTAWLGIAAYLLCLYFTLSGFVDMGIGLAGCFGIKLPQSFNYPLFRRKVSYFASRWHVHVIQWFRRYVSRPLNSISKKKWYRRAVFAVAWGVFGFWYTFGVNGFIWGILIGVSILIENKLSSDKILNATGMFYTFIVTVICAVFLSGDTLSYSARYLLAMIGGNRIFADSLSFYLLKSYAVIFIIAVYASTDLFKNMLLRSSKRRVRNVISAFTPLVVLLLLAACTALISYSGGSEMILLSL